MFENVLIEEKRSIPICETCDVLVAGGGTAGCVAAIAAARSGVSTVLIEQLPMPSGTMTNGGIIANSFYSTYTSSKLGTKRVVAGIAQEILDRVIKAGGCPGYTKVDETVNPYHRPYIVISDHEVYKVVISKMLMEAGVKVYLHTFLADVITCDNKVSAVIIESKSGREAIVAKMFIDCTGDGDLAYRAGAEYIDMHDNYKYAGNTGMAFGIGNVDLNKFVAFGSQNGIITEEIHGEKYSSEDTLVRISVNFNKNEELRKKAKEAGFNGALFLSINERTINYVNGIGKPNVDVTDVHELSMTEMELRIRAYDFVNFLKENIPGFEQGFVNWTGNQLGIRASRIIKCEYSITNDDIVFSKRFDDEMGMFGFHDLSPIADDYVMKNKGYYGLPYRMILPKKLKNVFVAGRMVSETFEAQMSTRNTMCCMVQGQAAGTAAALSVQKGVLPKELDYMTLREKLISDGVYIEPQI